MKLVPISPDLVSALKQLRLGRMLDTLAERIALAEAHETPLQDFLLTVFLDEIARRQSSAATRRAEEAGLDPDLVLERWDKTAKVHFDRRVFQELCSLRFAQTQRNVVVLGQVGVGKTFIASALGHLACRSGYQVRFTRADALLHKLKQSRFDNSRDAVLSELCAADLLFIDDFALEPMYRDESRDVYQLFVERNARASTVVTSNRDTSEWIAMFDDVLLAQSAVDRFANNAYDLVIEGESYRPRLKPNIDKDGPPPAAPAEKMRPHPRARKRPKAT